MRFIRDIIAWIRSLDMEFINGRMDGYIKEILIMTWEMVSGNCMKVWSLFTEAFGIMENSQMKKPETTINYSPLDRRHLPKRHLRFIIGRLVVHKNSIDTKILASILTLKTSSEGSQGINLPQGEEMMLIMTTI